MAMSDYVELAEARMRLANEYLKRGYRLISVESITGTGQHPNNKTEFVRRALVYVMGRTADIEHWAPPKAPERTATEEKEG